MSVTGEVNANKVKISGAATITGNFFSKNVELNSTARITGITKCDNCVFHDTTSFTGEISVSNSQFDSKIDVEARESEFTNTKLQDIYVKKLPQHDEEIITLSQNSSAKNITFEDGNGKVILKNGSHITGRVEGGKIINN
jgi:cytoskeletal protein CcmA (bactofilin family)